MSRSARVGRDDLNASLLKARSDLRVYSADEVVLRAVLAVEIRTALQVAGSGLKVGIRHRQAIGSSRGQPMMAASLLRSVMMI